MSPELSPSQPAPPDEINSSLPPPDTNGNPPTKEELKALNDFATAATKQLTVNIQQNSQYINRSYKVVFCMYILLFLVGVFTAAGAIAKGWMAKNGTDAISALIFAGLSAASFFSLFIVKPLESLERNAFFSSWLIAIMNTYWSRLMYFQNEKTIDQDLKDATTDLVTELSGLADKYAAAVGKSPPLANAGERPTAGLLARGEKAG